MQLCDPPGQKFSMNKITSTEKVEFLSNPEAKFPTKS